MGMEDSSSILRDIGLGPILSSFGQGAVLVGALTAARALELIGGLA